MHKKLITLIFSLLLVFSYSLKGYSAQVNNNETYTISETSDILDYEGNNSPYMQKYRKVLLDKMVDPGKALGLSAVYFGLGQLYSGDTTRGAWILGGGTVLTALVLLVVVPRLANRQEGVTAAGTGIAYGALAVAYLWNIRDAYMTAEKVNKDLNDKLLLSESLIKQFEKINVSTSPRSLNLSYRLLDF